MTNEKKYRIGIDLGGTNIKVGIVDQQHKIIAHHSVKTLVERNYTEIIKDMADAVYHVLEQCNISLSECSALGIGSPGCIDFQNGVVVFAGNLHWEHVPILQELKKYIDLPMGLSNDANCAALGEVVGGAAKEYQNAIMITLGTGVGGGIVMNKKIFEGGHPGGTELGHTTVVSGGEYCTCGRHGCFEAYSSATALIRDTKRAAQNHPESLLNTLCHGNLDEINGITPFDAAKQGDVAGKEVVENYIKYLGEGIVNMVNIFRPDVVLLSGGVCNQGAYLTDPLNEYIKKYCFAGERAFIPPVIRATLGNDAGIIGAASIVEV